MSLISLSFALFMLVVLALNWALRPMKPLYRLFLLGASYVFYGSLSPVYLLLLVHFSIWSYVLGFGIGRWTRPWARKLLVAVHLFIGIGGLVFFKYYDLLYELVARTLVQPGLLDSLPQFDLAIPVGISFFTFQGLSYTIDVYRDRSRVVKNPLDVLNFVAFFPTLLSGPIMRAGEFVPQIGNMRLDNRTSSRAFSLILTGLAKKLVLSSYLFEHAVQPVFESPGEYSSICVLLGLLGYTMQILCDFSGYTDLVTGLALLMGYEIPPNFNHPYSARNLTDFWRRWHMSLSSWLRDYLYIPLGGNRKGPVRKSVNLLATMGLGGLWHGAGWNFLVWGCFHGVGLAVTHVVRDIRRRVSSGRGGGRTAVPPEGRRGAGKVLAGGVSWLLTFSFVTVGWAFFGAKDAEQALAILRRIVDFDQAGRSFSDPVFWVVSSLITLIAVYEALRLNLGAALGGILHRLPIAFQAVVLGLILEILLRLAPDGVPPFIYYQF